MVSLTELETFVLAVLNIRILLPRVFK